MEFRVLGPLEVWCDGQRVPVSAAKQRTLLAILLLRAGRVVAAEELIDQLWGERPPASARKTLHNYLRRLRTTLAAGAKGLAAPPMLRTEPPGYLLRLGDAELDLHRFQRLREQAQQATAAGDLDRAAAILRQALGLWRGPALADVAAETLLRTEAGRLEAWRLAALEGRIQAELELGRHADLVGELEALAAQHPLRESFCGQLMLALYRSGRQAEALQVYRNTRRSLVEELGIEPGSELRRLERAILVADPSLAVPARPAPSAPLAQASDRAIPAQLPADVAAFTGRTPQLQELDRLLEPGANTTAVVISAIAGTAGVGKTALAVHWAHRVRDRFGDGQLHVNLRGYASAPPVRSVDALAGFLHALGVPAEQVPVDLDEAAALFRTLLTDRRMLVLLDNARSAEQVRPLLPGSSGCLVLVTSRDRLGGLIARDGARRLVLDVLTPDEAVALLARLLGAERVAAEPQAARELAELCGFLPLALRIAAARVTDQPRHSIAGYRAELVGNRLAALEVAEDEQAAVRAAFHLSYAALAAGPRRLFRLLELVPGPDVTAEAAAALAGTTPGQARSLLDRLAAAHLVDQRTPGRFGLHDLLRLYAAERACQEDSQADRRAAIEGLYNWYLLTVDAAAQRLYPTKLRLSLPQTKDPPSPVGFDDHIQALAWLDAERPNLVAATVHAAQHGPRPVAWLLADALRGYFFLRMHTVDWLTVAHAGLAAAKAGGNPAGQAAAQLSLADAHYRQSQHHRAVEHYTQAWALSWQAGWLEGQSAALGNLGCLYWRSGQLQDAAHHLSQAWAIDRQLGWLPGEAISLSNLGAVCRELGQLQQAADYHIKALGLDRKLGSRSGEAADLSNLGDAYHGLGRLGDALDHLTQALDLHREVGNRGTEADTLRILAEVHRDLGRSGHALELAEAAVALARDTGEHRFEADALNALASIHQRLARYRDAIDHHRQALHLAREVGIRFPQAVALVGLAMANRDLGDLQQAQASGNQALALARQAGFGVLEGQALTALASIHLDQGHPDQAILHARQAVRLHRQTGHRLGRAHALVILGHALRHTGRADAALPCWQEALAVFTDLGTSDADQVRDLLQTHSRPR